MPVTPSQLQELLSAAIPAREPVLVTGAPGVGKCLEKGTPILMFNGEVKAVENINEGDILMGPDSKPRTVRALSHGLAPLYEVKPVKGEPYYVTGNHVLSFRTSPRRPGQRSKLENLTVNDYFAESKTRKHHLKGWRTGVDFAPRPYYVDPYILGLWLGDGDQARMAFTNMDPEVIDSITQYASVVGLKAKHYKSTTRAAYVKHIALSGKHGGNMRVPRKNVLTVFLDAYGLRRGKYIPLAYKANTRTVRLELLAGIIDTDGEYMHGCYAVTQKSERLAVDVAFVARSLGLAAYVKPCEKTSSNGVKGTYHRVTISGETSIIPVRVARKKATKRAQVKDALVTGVTVRYSHTGEYFGFSVDGDGLFLLGDFTVTHNSDIVSQAATAAGAELILSHPAVSDPTDFKGLPWPDKDANSANFLPFGDFHRALNATVPTVWFLDDLGQSSPAVQAAAMQLLLARRVNGHILPDTVTFVAATNRRTDRAGVSGILEPVKSRFVTIVELEPTIDDWCNWAIDHGAPSTLIAFIRFRPDLLSKFEATADLTNSPVPRTWAHLARVESLKLSQSVEAQAMAGAVGEGPALEYLGFRSMVAQLVNLDAILLDPDRATIPSEPSQLYATAVGLAGKANSNNFARIATYVTRMVTEADKGEFAVLCSRDAVRRDPKIIHSNAYIQLCSGPVGKLITGQVS